MAKNLSPASIIKAKIDGFLCGNKRVQKGIENMAKGIHVPHAHGDES